MQRWLIGLAALLVALPALALEPEERMDDPALEARARALYQDLRCVVCQNNSLDDSPSQLAADMRAVVREQLRAGASDQAVLDFMVARYGDFALLTPPVQANTYALWLAPVALVAIGGVIVVIALRRRRAAPTPDPLTAEERAAVDRLLAEEREDGADREVR